MMEIISITFIVIAAVLLLMCNILIKVGKSILLLAESALSLSKQ